MDWNRAAKDRKDNSLSPAAKSMRDDTRKAMLAPFAPTFILNDWTAPETLPKGLKVESLPDMHPVAARGVVSFLNEPGRRLSEAVSLAVRPHWASLVARAKD